MSDIFNEFAKIAIDRGLISEAQDVGDETNPRFDSLSNDDIKALYGVKPNGEDEKHILDQAHPESVVVSPAYDKINGLVENLFERQDIMAWIATKPNDGKHTNERYVKASQDLTMALLNTAMILDRTGDVELMKLADSCAARLSKRAIAPLALALYLGAAAVGTMGIVNNFGGMIDNGVLSNADRTIEELQDLLDDAELPGKEEDIQNLIEDIRYIKGLNEELQAFNIEATNDEAKLKADISKGQDMLRKYVKGVRHLNKRISSTLAMAEAQAMQGQQSSWLAQNLGDFGISLEKAWGAIWGNDVRDALVALETLRESLSASIPSMTRLYSVVKSKAKSGDHKSLEELLKTKTSEEDKEEQEIPGFLGDEEGAGSAYKQQEEADEDVVELSKYIPTSTIETPREKAKHEEDLPKAASRS